MMPDQLKQLERLGTPAADFRFRSSDFRFEAENPVVRIPHSAFCIQPRSGFSLIELLIVVAMLGILAAVLIPNSSTSQATDLSAVAAVVISELDYARDLALTYGSEYELTFSEDGSQLILQHSGSNTALDVLPTSAFSAVGDANTQRVLRLDEVTSLAGGVWIVSAVAVADSGNRRVTSLEYGPLGETTRSETTILWLASGSDSARRYLPIEVNPITGMAEAGEITTTLSGALTLSNKAVSTR